MTARGTYIDRSTPFQTSHILKILLKSPSFPNDVILNCKFHQDPKNLRVGLYAEQVGADKYALVLNNTILSPGRIITYAEAKYKNGVYSVLTNVDMDRVIYVDLHLDRFRDVQLTLKFIVEEGFKEFGLSVEWDANRDPSLKFTTKLLLLADSDESGKNVSGTVTLSYPGRLIVASSLFAMRLPNNYLCTVLLEWDPKKYIRAQVEGDYSLAFWSKILKLEAQLLTPFDNWRKTSFDARFVLRFFL